MTGIFLGNLKITKLKPLYKKRDMCCFNKDRSISMPMTISGIFERIMYTHLNNYFNVNNLLTKYGFGFINSTELALFKLIDYIIMEMDDLKNH